MNLVSNVTTFTGLPDIPLTSLRVALNGGPSALFGTLCKAPSGTATATLTDQNGDKTVKAPADFKLVGKPYGTAPYGIAMPKDLKLEQPVLDALKVLMSNGQYKAILNKWGIADGAISNPQINGAIS